MTQHARALLRLASSLLLFTLHAPPLAAQRPVPEELVHLIAGAGRVYAGEVPEPMQARVPVPADARVIGSVLRGPATGVVYAAIRDEPDGALARYEDQLRLAGWAPGPRPGGLQPPGSSRPEAQYCRGDDALLVTARPHAADETVLVLNLTAAAASLCATPGPRADLTLPMLRPPPLAGRLEELHRCGRGPGRRGEGVEVLTSLTPTELLAHYAAQLEAQAFRPADDAAAAVWRGTAPDGSPLQIALLISRSDETGCVYVHADAQRPTGR
jgi:hypothetical protein